MSEWKLVQNCQLLSVRVSPMTELVKFIDQWTQFSLIILSDQNLIPSLWEEELGVTRW